MAKTGALNHWGLEAGTHTKLLGIDGDEEINRGGTKDPKLMPGFGHADEGVLLITVITITFVYISFAGRLSTRFQTPCPISVESKKGICLPITNI